MGLGNERFIPRRSWTINSRHSLSGVFETVAFPLSQTATARDSSNEQDGCFHLGPGEKAGFEVYNRAGLRRVFSC